MIKRPRPFERKYFDLDLERGKEWENYFASIIGNSKIECKRDRLARKTGNIFIEYECFGKPSGIATTKSDYWVVGIESKNGDVEVAILMSVSWLKDKCRSLWHTNKNVSGGDDNAAKGILISMDEFRK